MSHSPVLPAHNLRCAATLLAASLTLSLAGTLSGCSRASATALPDPQVVATARQQIELIPPPAKSRYMAVHSLNGWENPYLTVQANMATLHITLADANPSQIGVGGMLRPVSARRQDVTVRLSDLPAALNAIPENSWPVRPRGCCGRGARHPEVRRAVRPPQHREHRQDPERSRRCRLRLDRKHAALTACASARIRI